MIQLLSKLQFVVVATFTLFCLVCSASAQPEYAEKTIATSAQVLLATNVIRPTLVKTNRDRPPAARAEDHESDDIALVRKVEAARIHVIEKVIGSVVAIYGDDRQGGGSGVIIDPSGIALTNHHVIEGAGTSGWGGLADGRLYRWELVGTDPGGDIAIIQLTGKDIFPWSVLGNSDLVRVGDWAFAMGNPFLLAEDQVPTVTLGIVSGIERFQGGSANQLVYGNCIQIDSSINPGNSGGPLFNMDGDVIGINGRGSFRDRGRVNVGLGYAISVNQIKNFLGELLATKLIEHGTLEANFSMRGNRVICSVIDLDSPIAKAGLALGDELLEFEGVSIRNANQFMNLISTLPHNWPARITFKKPDGRVISATVRLLGLPYPKPRPAPQRSPQPDRQPGDTPKERPSGEPEGQPNDEPSDEEEDPPQSKEERDRQLQKQQEMIALLSAEPNSIRDSATSARHASHFVGRLKTDLGLDGKPDQNLDDQSQQVRLTDELYRDGKLVGTQTLWIARDGRFRCHWLLDGKETIFGFDGLRYWKVVENNREEINVTALKLSPILGQIVTLVSLNQPDEPFSVFGDLLLDGSDRSDGFISCRLKTLDQGDDWYYVWLSLFDQDGHTSIRLTKTASELNADRYGGAVVYRDWHVENGFAWAKNRLFVQGLQEEVTLVLKNIETSFVDIDARLFEFAQESSDVDQ
ncbi:MAG TPA: trypsin-like peptidase domain-containing protein [Pirellulaceae bacterium]|nr:trypsin-like peptidase domain-containing protein [Pirellulaceae bacterium]HMO93354.1 trypsin-like peptidase domain-containing protein [Pirellulaceae bacterium]HMP70125.1 trypsin-like peptidase domain-containing protein [Pirellulaceae bacterium]